MIKIEKMVNGTEKIILDESKSIRELHVFGNCKSMHELHISGEPKSMPTLNQYEALVCEFNSIETMYFIIDSFSEMRSLYKEYSKGMAFNIKWFIAKDFKFITVL